MDTIKKLKAREILDSRGNPTVEVDLILSDSSLGRASVPSGASKGSYEAIELRDSGSHRFGGLGVLKAVENVNTIIAGAIIGKRLDQTSLDKIMVALDGTPNKSKLGANAILGVSMAFARAKAESEKIPLHEYFHNISEPKEKMCLPVPMILVLEGGKHADKGSDLQEFMIVPHKAKNFREALRYGTEIYHTIGEILKSKSFNTNVGFEGAFGPNLGSNEKALEIIMEGIKAAGYIPGVDIGIAIDCAGNEFCKNGIYDLKTESRKLSGKEILEYYTNWCEKYPIVSIEDGLAEDDWTGWKTMTEKLGNKIQIVGDDLFATNIERLKIGIERGAGNSILIKLNQIGTITETIEVIRLAKKNKYKIIVSHRSGETEDAMIADFAVGVGADQIKTGAPRGTDRTAKYNQLLRIEESIG
ncbi:MAG: phosphopyruvate hydratase [bacterium]|nr:phosphopyruvate hydratase [bacterium]